MHLSLSILMHDSFLQKLTYRESPFAASVAAKEAITVPIKDYKAFIALFAEPQSSTSVDMLNRYAAVLRAQEYQKSGVLVKAITTLFGENSHQMFATKHGNEPFRHITIGLVAVR